MKVYVIQCGRYSDRTVYGVTLSEEKAKQIVAKIEKANENAKPFSRYGYEDPYYDEYDTDDCEKQSCDELNTMWRISFLNSSYVIAESGAEDEGLFEDFDGAIIIWVWAENEDEALKIASDRRAKYIAEKEGLV